MFSLTGIFRKFWSAYRTKFRQAIPAPHLRAAEAILRCRTPEAGMVYYRCGDCGKVEPHPVSCGHRACNACGQHKRKEWEARQKSRLLPVPYHMVTFTVPSELIRSPPHGSLTPAGQLLRRCPSQPLPGASAPGLFQEAPEAML